MGTITLFKDWLQRRNQAADRPSVAVNTHGFVVGRTSVPWQTVSEIRGCRTGATDELVLEFAFAGQSVRVGEGQIGFAELETAMTCVFPSTATWRAAMLMPTAACNPLLLYRRC